MLAEYRTRHNIEEGRLAGEVSRVIDKQNYLRGQQHLREEHYTTLAPINTSRKLNQSHILPKLTLQQQRSTIKK